jgi:hypothetical protein
MTRDTDFRRDPFPNRRGDVRIDFLWGALKARRIAANIAKLSELVWKS